MALQAFLFLVTDHAPLAVFSGGRGVQLLPIATPMTLWFPAVALLAKIRRPGVALCAVYLFYYFAVNLKPIARLMSLGICLFRVATLAFSRGLLAVMALEASFHFRSVNTFCVLRMNESVMTISAGHFKNFYVRPMRYQQIAGCRNDPVSCVTFLARLPARLCKQICFA